MEDRNSGAYSGSSESREPNRAVEKNYFKTAAVGSFWISFQFVVNAVTTFLLSLILTRYLGPSTYGILAYFFWLISLFNVIFNFGLATTIQTFVPKFYFQGQAERGDQIVRQILNIQLRLIGGGLILVLPLIFFWNHFINFQVRNLELILILTFLATSMSVLNNLFTYLYCALQNFRKVSLVNTITQAGMLVAIIVMVLLRQNIFSIVTSILIVSSVSVIYYFTTSRHILQSLWRVFSERLEVKKILSFSALAYSNILLTLVIYDKSEFFFLGKFHGGEQLAIYGIAYTISLMIATLFDPIVTVFVNILSELVSKNDWSRIFLVIYKSSKYISLVMFPLITLVFLFGKFVIQFLYGVTFIQVSFILPILILSQALTRIFGTAWIIPTYKNDLKKVVTLLLYVAAINILLDFLLIPGYGFWGATLANSLTQVIALLVFAVYIRKFNISIFNQDYLKILTLNILLFVVSLGAFYVVENVLLASLVVAFLFLGYSVTVVKKFIHWDDIEFLRSLEALAPPRIKRVISFISRRFELLIR